MNEELKEWLGIKPADFFVYAAAGAVAWMYFNQNTSLDIFLSASAVILAAIGCILGMRSDVQLTATTNRIKQLAYPLFLVAGLICIYLNFSRWNDH